MAAGARWAVGVFSPRRFRCCCWSLLYTLTALLSLVTLNDDDDGDDDDDDDDVELHVLGCRLTY